MALMAGGVAGQQPSAEAPGLNVTLYRTWRPPNLTVVEGLFRVDSQLLGTPGACQYQVGLQVFDTAGTALVQNQWQGHCPQAADGSLAGALETFRFAVVPAQYTVRVTVTPEGKDAAKTATLQLHGLPENTLVSDLILAKNVGMVDSTNAKQWNLRTGDVGLQAASEVTAEPDHPLVAYYLEVYPTADHPLNGTLYGVVKQPDGRELTHLKLQQLNQIGASRPIAGKFSVKGLAPGHYELEARLDLQDTVISRTHPFNMLGAAPVAAAAAQSTGGLADYFAQLSDAELAQQFDGIVVWMRRQADRNLYTGLTPDGKRRYLQRFFANQPPTGSGESALQLFQKRVQQVNLLYGERAGRGAVNAWETDRGRIYMIRGEPATRVQRVLPQDGGAPFEIWYYTIGHGYVYLFADDAGMGHYRLIFSNDPDESSLPDWDRLVGQSAKDELSRFGVVVN